MCACESLDEKSLTQISTEQFYKNDIDALSALTAAYARLKSGNGYYRQVFLSAMHASSDQGLSTFIFKDFRTGTLTNTHNSLNSIWRDIYIAIRDANNVIANVPNIEMDEDLKNRIIAEARFLRGLHYFNLVRCFGEVPLRTEPVKTGDDSGLPISDITEIYQLIIDDLIFAAENCWGRLESKNGYQNNIGRATNTAAHALLGKVYLRIASCKRTSEGGVQGNDKYSNFKNSSESYYQLAKDHCDAAISGEGFLLSNSLEEWSTIFDPDKGNNPEMIFEVQGSSIVGQGTAVSNLFSPKDSGLSGTGFGGANKLKPKFVNFKMDKTDNRYQYTVIRYYENNTRSFTLNPTSIAYIPRNLSNGNTLGTLWQTYSSKYIDPEATTEYTSRQNWHVVRLADVHLMRAEALAELSQDPSSANIDFNLLRSRVETSEFDGSGMTMDDFRTELLRERAVELYMEGHRFFDLTRMGVLDEYCRILHGQMIGQRQPEDYFWPIPIAETTANSNID
jgi:hypothetical protein